MAKQGLSKGGKCHAITGGCQGQRAKRAARRQGVQAGSGSSATMVPEAGEAMRARICQVIEYEDGLIIRQRNYDCFEPF